MKHNNKCIYFSWNSFSTGFDELSLISVNIRRHYFVLPFSCCQHLLVANAASRKAWCDLGLWCHSTLQISTTHRMIYFQNWNKITRWQHLEVRALKHRLFFNRRFNDFGAFQNLPHSLTQSLTFPVLWFWPENTNNISISFTFHLVFSGKTSVLSH